jgi:hypothetical protein
VILGGVFIKNRASQKSPMMSLDPTVRFGVCGGGRSNFLIGVLK